MAFHTISDQLSHIRHCFAVSIAPPAPPTVTTFSLVAPSLYFLLDEEKQSKKDPYTSPAMSSTPKAKRSQVADLVVVPDSWDSHPTIEYSHIKSCKFEGLNSGNRIERSRFTNVALSSDGSDKSKIERSVIKDTDIRHSVIERSEIQGSKIDTARVERSRFTLATLTGPKVTVERSVFEECEVKGDSKIERSNLTQVLIANSKVESSNMKSSFVTNSRLERATITDCDVGDCKIQRTNFTGMYLRNGIWERGDLVGRVDKTKEVICKQKSEMPSPPEFDRSETHKVKFRFFSLMNKANKETQPADVVPESSFQPRMAYPDDSKLPPYTEEPGKNEKEREWSDAGMATPPSPTFSAVTGILDEEIARTRLRDDYDGPDIDSLPPYDEIDAQQRA